ncbi:hypothetical protein JTE90_024065 [Oedothorax gibbosus]|uniref:Uncharacterized protein n=1 Tax=Oedothorax gibbosus TaxID=931172 RepID=A0AAV6TMV5_9ARAC|nr:hypothetical protein JTE90_024065 [Oedothorax gibbosus]
MLSNGSTLAIIRSEGTAEEDDDSPDNSTNVLSKRKGSDLEGSGVFVDGYTGPIHRWEHPGYEFLTESSKGR